MPGVPTDESRLYRFPERYGTAASQSARRPALYRILSDLLSGQDEAPLQLRPAWLDLICGQGHPPPLWLGPSRPSRGDARPWACGAAGPGRAASADCRAGAPGRRRAGRRRGARAGRRVQRRRCRAGRDSDRTHRDESAGPRVPCLTSPARLTLRQTARWEPSRPERSGRHILSIGHSNVRSIVPKMDDINRLLQQHNFDVFCATETWLTDPAQDRILIFPGYRVERRDRRAPPGGGRRSAGRGGGVAVIYRAELTAAVLPIPSAGPCKTLWLSISGGGRRSATVGVVYRPPIEPCRRRGRRSARPATCGSGLREAGVLSGRFEH